MEDVRNIKHHFSSGVYAREMTLPKGYEVLTHNHKFDHLSILAKGKALVIVDGIESVFNSPCTVTIKAGVEHKIIALEDIVWFCIHATKETNKDLMDEVLSEKS